MVSRSQVGHTECGPACALVARCSRAASHHCKLNVLAKPSQCQCMRLLLRVCTWTYIGLPNVPSCIAHSHSPLRLDSPAQLFVRCFGIVLDGATGHHGLTVSACSVKLLLLHA
eukprot:5866954-Amphidinium_carterae.2